MLACYLSSFFFEELYALCSSHDFLRLLHIFCLSSSCASLSYSLVFTLSISPLFLSLSLPLSLMPHPTALSVSTPLLNNTHQPATRYYMNGTHQKHQHRYGIPLYWSSFPAFTGFYPNFPPLYASIIPTTEKVDAGCSNPYVLSIKKRTLSVKWNWSDPSFVTFFRARDT